MRVVERWRGSHHGQTDLSLVAISGERRVGYVDFALFEGGLYIEMLEVDPMWRRKGVASRLIRELGRQYPEYWIYSGMLSPEGSQFIEGVGQRLERPLPNRRR